MRNALRLCLLLVALALGLRIQSASAASASWTASGSGSWATSGNWSAGGPPNSTTDVATFPDHAGPSHTITINGNFSAQTLNFTNSSGDDYTLNCSGGNSILLYSSLTSNAGLDPVLSCPVVLENTITVTGGGGGFYRINGAGSLTGAGGINMTSGRFYMLTPSTYTGTTTITSGDYSAGAANVFPTDSAFVLADDASAILEPGGSNQTIASLSGGAASQVFLESSILTIGDSTDTTYAGTISDSGASGGGIVKQGTGKLTLTGTNTYTGATVVNAGTLDVNGSVAGTGVTVNLFGTLKGSGTLPTVNAAGTVAPGNSIGTLNGTSFNFLSGSTLQNELNASGSTDLVNATTSATINSGANLQITPAAGTYTVGQTFTIISAPTISGTFSSVTSTLDGVTFRVNYFPTHVDVVVASVAATPGVPNTGSGGPKGAGLSIKLVLAGVLLAIAISLMLPHQKHHT